MRILCVIATCAFVLNAEAQSANHWLRRWRVEQQEASVTIARLHLAENATYATDGAFGKRSMRIESDVTVERGPGPSRRSATDVHVDGQPIESRERGRRRRLQAPIRSDLLREADQLLFPFRLLSVLDPSGPLEILTVDGREVVRVVTVPERGGMAIRRVTWFFDRSSGHLMRARAIIRGQNRATLVAELTYTRRDGLDIAEQRELNGSFALPRRTRTYTVLVESVADYVLTAVESLE